MNLFPITSLFVFTAFFGSVFLTGFFKRLALKRDITDDPQQDPDRKSQSEPVPLLGGLGIVLVGSVISLAIVLLSYFDIFSFSDYIEEANWADKMLWFLLGVGVMSVGGVLDDMRKLSSLGQILFGVVGVSIAVFGGGLEVHYFADEVASRLPWIADVYPSLMAVLWLSFCVAATKFLDGHDGLVSSISVVSLGSIAYISFFDSPFEPLIGIIAVVWIFGILGFLPGNLPPAKVYLGESASMILGFVIGFLAIISSAKVVTAVSVLGYFVIDLLIVWGIRLMDGRNPLTSGDRSHWHHRLSDMGFNKRQVLGITIALVFCTTLLALTIGREMAWWILLVQAVVMVIMLLLGRLFARD